CPADDPTPPVYLADPNDCAYYCECSGGLAWSFECDPGLLFDDVLDVCDWADNVDCGNRPIIS
ncbi:hypothetical protein GQ599_10170, partial [Streptococcus thermophilus]|nr:hypothetical protein [Streptococcus thermophilus]